MCNLMRGGRVMALLRQMIHAACCEVTPTCLRNLRIDMLKSSLIIFFLSLSLTLRAIAA